jgi:hypothetical protein
VPPQLLHADFTVSMVPVWVMRAEDLMPGTNDRIEKVAGVLIKPQFL